jgi:beta-lactamase regulating signal transducer with metallopeptidase domain
MSFLTDCVIKITAVMVLALIVVRLLRTQSAAIRHLVLLLSVVIALLIPGTATILPSWHWSTASTISSPGSVPIDSKSIPQNNALVSSPIHVNPFVPTLSGIARFVWLAGILFSLAAVAVGIIRLMAINAASRSAGNEDWDRLNTEISRAYRVKRPIRILQSPNPSVLITWGLFKPTVILPARAEMWDLDRATVVLSHELAHVRRMDWLTQILTEVFRALCWFHPLVWMVCNRLRLESELACDDAVLSGGISGVDYAGHLLDLARELHTPDRAWSSALAMARVSTVERRFEAMLNPFVNRQPVRTVHLAAIAMVSAFLAIPVATFTSTAAPALARPAQEAHAAAIHPEEPSLRAVPESRSTVAERRSPITRVSVAQEPPRFTGEIISVRLKDADIRDFFKFLSDFTGKNFVVDPDVQGHVTLTLNSIPWDQALDVVLKDHGLAFVQEPSLVRIGATASMPAVSRAEQANGRLTGAVFDASTLPIPGAQVRLTSPALTDGRAAITNSDGSYSFDNLPTGDYRIAISLPGFKNLNVDAVNVSGLGHTELNLRLDVAILSEEITVTSSVSARSSAPQLGPPPPCSPLLPPSSANPTTGGEIQQAMLISHTAPIYPQQAHDAQIQGLVVIEAVIGTDGRVINIKPITGHPLLAPAVSMALSQWCYRPTLLNGVPVETVVTVTVVFRLVN